MQVVFGARRLRSCSVDDTRPALVQKIVQKRGLGWFSRYPLPLVGDNLKQKLQHTTRISSQLYLGLLHHSQSQNLAKTSYHFVVGVPSQVEGSVSEDGCRRTKGVSLGTTLLLNFAVPDAKGKAWSLVLISLLGRMTHQTCHQRPCPVPQFQLAEALQYIFGHIDAFTEISRHKYKVRISV